MKQPKLFTLLFPFIMMAIPWIYLAIIWNDLPATIPTHFGISGEPDKFGDKGEIMLAPLILSVVGILMYFLLRNISKIDPKKKYAATSSNVLSKLAVVSVVLLCAVSLMICYWTLKGKVEGLSMLFCGLGLFYAYIGNIFHSLKPNYFAGFRLPWALESEDNWRQTHQLASKIWFFGGILLAIVSLLLPQRQMVIVFISITMIMALIPTIYSYNLYRKTINR